jgi:hypothetical protein
MRHTWPLVTAALVLHLVVSSAEPIVIMRLLMRLSKTKIHLLLFGVVSSVFITSIFADHVLLSAQACRVEIITSYRAI